MELLEQMKYWRRSLHKIPETGFQETKTSNFIYNELEKMGYHPQRITETGIIVYIDASKDKTIAFRSDMDALNIQEDNDVDFKSTHQGCMHACGHDGHMAALLGLAKRLQGSTDYPYNILLIFQPGEEKVDGSKKIIETGIFEKYNVKAIFGLHMFPDVDEGKIACRKGPLMAQSGELDVTIHGKSAHAGKYNEGVDTIVIACQLILAYQSIISRMISPMQPVVLHVGSIQGGSSKNIVAKTTSFHGTVRTYSEAVFEDVQKAIISYNKGMENVYNCRIETSLKTFNPPVINDDDLVEQLADFAGNSYEELKEPVMLAEDFAHYQKVVPGVFFYVGTKCPEYQSGLHTPTFQFHEDVLLKAVDVYEHVAKGLKLEDK